MEIRFRGLAALCFVSFLVGAGIVLAIGYSPGGVVRELERTRQALDGAVERSVALERRLDEAKGLAAGSAVEVERAVGAAGKIADRGQRIVALVESIRNVIGGLRKISELTP